MGTQTESKTRSSGLYLLTSLVLLILISPFFEGSRIGGIANTVLYSVVMLTIVHAVSEEKRIRMIALVWALLALVLLWSSPTDPNALIRIIGLSFFVTLNLAAIVLVFRRIFSFKAVTFDTLCHSVALYLLFGVTFALIYLISNLAITESFAELAPTLDAGWSNFHYFSFATLTTLGYGDITPDLPFIKVIAVMEAVIGVLYVAILVARLVSLYKD